MIEFLPFYASPVPGKFRRYVDKERDISLFIERVFGTYEVYGTLFGSVPTHGVSSFYHTYNNLKGARCIIYQHNNGKIFELSSADFDFVDPSEFFGKPE